MKIRRQQFLPWMLLSSCFVFTWGCGNNSISEVTNLSSTSELGEVSTYNPLVLNLSQKNVTLPFDDEIADDPNAPAPAIIYSLDQIEKAKNPQSLMSFHNVTSNRGCTGGACEEDQPNPKFMSCSNSNGYLEKQMSAFPQSSILSKIIKNDVRTEDGEHVAIEPIIKASCMRMSMEAKFGVNSKNFKTCDANGKMNGARAIRPCISGNYFNLVRNSFNFVSSCLKDYMSPGAQEDNQNLDVRAAYAMINIESGFHVNAVSGTGAGGIGQLTGAAITDSNTKEIAEIRAALEVNKNPSCAALSHEFLDSMKPMRPEAAASCERISLKNGNPVKNMIYTYAYLKWSKKAMDRVIFNDKRYKTKFTKLSDYDKQKIQRALMVWSHNTGPAGTWTPAMTLLNTAYRNKPVTNAEQFISELQQYMKKFPARANKSTARRTETSKYFPAITNLLNKIETNVGGGSCVN